MSYDNFICVYNTLIEQKCYMLYIGIGISDELLYTPIYENTMVYGLLK